MPLFFNPHPTAATVQCSVASLPPLAGGRHPSLPDIGRLAGTFVYMAIRTIRGLEELRTLVGTTLGTSDWLEITQARVDAFAEATGDRQWIHCDPERAARESPYGATVAHGFLTLSLCNALTESTFAVDGVKTAINYGANRVRFPAPVKVGSRLRMRSDLVEIKETKAGVQAILKQTFEAEGEPRPACIVETIVRLFW